MKKLIETSKVGLWFFKQTQTKNWLTSKTFWNSAGQKVGLLAVVLLGVDPGITEQLAVGIAALAAFVIDLWVRKHTTKRIGDPMPSKHRFDPLDDDNDIGWS